MAESEEVDAKVKLGGVEDVTLVSFKLSPDRRLDAISMPLLSTIPSLRMCTILKATT